MHRHRPKNRQKLWLWLAAFLLASQCANPVSPATPVPAPETDAPAPQQAAPPQDLLDSVRQRGYLKVAVRVWPDGNFNPPLFRNTFGALDGYEVDLARAIADSLGVDLEMVENDPRRIAGGNWQGEWDLGLAWLPITDNARQTLVFSAPYAFDRGGVVVHADNQTLTGLNSLSGRKIGVPAQTHYQQLLAGQALSIDGQFIAVNLPPNLEIKAYNRDGNALRDLAQGDGEILDAAVHSMPVLEAALASGLPLKLIAADLFPTPIGIAFDRAGLPAERLRLAVDDVLAAMRQNGNLAELSTKWYGQNLSVAP